MSLCFSQTHNSFVMITSKGYRFYVLKNSLKAEDFYQTEFDHEMCDGRIRFIGGLLDNGFGVMVFENAPDELIFYDFKRKCARTKFCFLNNILAAKISRSCIIVFLLDKIYVVKDFVNQDFNEAVPKSEVSMPPNPKAICAYLALEKSLFPEHFVAYPCYQDPAVQLPDKLNSVEILDIIKKESVMRIHAHEHPITAIAFSLSGFRIAIACEDSREIYVFNWKKGSKLHKCINGRLSVTINALVFSKCGKFLVSTSNTETMHIFNLDLSEERNHKVLKARDIPLKISTSFRGTESVCAIDVKEEKLKVMVAKPPDNFKAYYTHLYSKIDRTSWSAYNLIDDHDFVEIPSGKRTKEKKNEREGGDRFRNRRRASIAPLPSLRLNSKEMLASDFDTHSLASNQASITSINSLASLLREKMQAFPQMIRKKKRETKDYKIKIFVIILFFIIVFLIGYAYVTYHQNVLTKSYFEKIKFKSQDRIFRLLNHEQKEMISGNLGITIGVDSSPFQCLEDNRRSDGSVCIQWNDVARLYMNYQDMDVFRCYTIQWQALSPGVYPTDCYELRRDNGLWFGGSYTKGMEWSLSNGNFDFEPFGSGDTKVHQFGNAVKRYFINSIGVAIQVNDRTPLHISVNRTENKFCLRGMNDNFTFVNRLTKYPELEYKICTTEDMRSLHMLMTQKSLWDGLKEADIKVLHSLIEEPVWKIPFQSDVETMNETIIYNYSEDVIAMGFMRQGHILVNEFWQENIGDFVVDQQRFPTLKDTIDVLHRRGFKVVFTIQPFISTDSPNFKDAVKNKLLIYERHSERSIPALTRYKSSSSSGVLDITNNASIPWLKRKLEALQTEYKVDSFYLDLGTGYNLPHYYQCRETLDNPDMYAKLFSNALESLGFIGVSTASVVPKPPAFLSTPPINSSWSGLRELLSFVLNYGVIGYPFVLPGAIGGDYKLMRAPTKMVSFYSLGQPELPEQDLFIRWMQLMTFLPAMQYSHLPSEYKSDYVTEVTKELTSIRQKIVIPLLKKYLSESMNEGLPLVRPLWMLDPHDPACLIVSDEFSVGEELIVAPILEKDMDEREVYLPQGVWKDGVDGSLRKGSRWIHSYKVPKDKIAYFIKMPDNTRF